MKKVYNINGQSVEDTTKIEYVKTNPKRKNSAAHQRFENYMKAKTVSQFFELGGTLADLRYDTNKEFVTLK
jgi:hypothetical protein